MMDKIYIQNRQYVAAIYASICINCDTSMAAAVRDPYCDVIS